MVTTPKFSNESPAEADKTPTPDVAPETAETPTEADKKYDDDTPMIVHRQQIINPDGTAGEKIHGPMPVEDWAAYEKEHKL